MNLTNPKNIRHAKGIQSQAKQNQKSQKRSFQKAKSQTIWNKAQIATDPNKVNKT